MQWYVVSGLIVSCRDRFALVYLYLRIANRYLREQGFMMFGYDAGVLGGVQTTEPFLSALGVR